MVGRIGILAVLSEAIDASAIDRASRAALRATLLDELKQDWEDFVRPLGEVSWEHMHDLYDEFYQKHSEHQNPTAYRLFIDRLCKRASAALTRVARESVEQRFGDYFTIKKHLSGVDYPAPVKPQYIEVSVEAREISDDANKHYGGYFRDDLVVKVFVKADDVHTTAMSLVQEIIFGEPGEEVDALVNCIAPTFVHEYVHLEQHLRGGSIAGDRDMGYISVNGKKRLTTRRNPRNGNLARLLYRSSANEIESFAADTASQLIAGFQRSYRHGFTNLNSDISASLAGIANGYVDTPSLRGYTQMAWGEWDEVANFYNIPKHELVRTYRRFLKSVYKKLWFYRRDKMGKAEWEDHASTFNNAPKQWIEWAKNNPMSKTAALMAYDIAFNNADIRYGPGNQLLYKGATFLEYFYFDTEWDFEKSMKIQRAFTALVERYHDKLSLPKAA